MTRFGAGQVFLKHWWRYLTQTELLRIGHETFCKLIFNILLGHKFVSSYIGGTLGLLTVLPGAEMNPFHHYQCSELPCPYKVGSLSEVYHTRRCVIVHLWLSLDHGCHTGSTVVPPQWQTVAPWCDYEVKPRNDHWMSVWQRTLSHYMAVSVS